MKPIYIETSAVLSWLLQEEHAEEIKNQIDKSDIILSSRLTFLETYRSITRTQAEDSFSAAEANRLKGTFTKASRAWTIMEITQDVQKKASESFPVEPIRTLDAIHLASALHFYKYILT